MTRRLGDLGNYRRKESMRPTHGTRTSSSFCYNHFPAPVTPENTEENMAVTRIPIPDWARMQKHDDRLELSLAETDLIVRTINRLEEQKIATVADLLNCTPQRLLDIPGFGEKTLGTIYVALEKIGFHRTSRRPMESGGTDHSFLRE
jgi:DNA-directed RNA polymerase subunit alpha